MISIDSTYDKMSKKVEIFYIRQFWSNSGKTLKAVFKANNGNFQHFFMISDCILPNLTVPDKSYFMKKKYSFSEKYQFCYI